MEGYGGPGAWDYSRPVTPPASAAPATTGEFPGEQWNGNAESSSAPNPRAPSAGTPPAMGSSPGGGAAAAGSWNPSQGIVNASSGAGTSTGAGTTGDGGHKPSSSLDRVEYSGEQEGGGGDNHIKGKPPNSTIPEELNPGMVARGNLDPDKEPKVEEMSDAGAAPAAAAGAAAGAGAPAPAAGAGAHHHHKVRDPERHHHHHHHHHKRDRDGNLKHEEEDRKPLPPPPGPGASRGARSRLRAKERDGWHGRAESAVTYKIGEAITEITKLWKESNGEAGNGAPLTLDVRVAADLATTSNRQVRGSQLWGTDIYTEDSDVVAVLMHTGYYSPTASPPPSCISEIRATLRIHPPQSSYKSTLRNIVRSRAWGAVSECSYSIERCRIVKSGGGIVDLESSVTRIPVVAPTLAPAAMERAMTTRSASSNAHRQQKFVQEVTVQYNLCNEPWFKYSMSIVADRGLKKSLYTSARLKKGDVLYLETHWNRYELSYDGEKGASNGAAAGTTATSAAAVGGAAAAGAGAPPAPVEKAKEKTSGEKHNGSCEKTGAQNGEYSEHYKWARCNAPLPLSVVRTKGVPLPLDCVEVLEDGLGWEEVQWSPTSVWIRGKEFVLARAQFLSSRVEVLVP